MSSVDELLKRIQKNKQRIIYISGKSCTGKTTLAHAIDIQFGYYNLELDSVIKNLEVAPGIKKYYEIYRTRNEHNLIEKFIEATSNLIQRSANKYPGVTFEGAIANNQTLKDLFNSLPERPLFVYLLPIDHTSFKERVIKRFRDSSPTNTNKFNQEFWQTTSSELVADFYSTGILSEELDAQISVYARVSMKEAEERLLQFKIDFPDVTVVTI